MSRNVLTYWRNSLADADRMALDLSKIEGTESIRLSDVSTGKIPANIVEIYFGKDENKEKDSLNVLLCPILLHPRTEHGNYNRSVQKRIAPLFVPGTLNREGILDVAENSFPWIPRNYLEPNDRSLLSLGSVENLDFFLSTNPLPQEDWLKFWNYTENLFRHVTGQTISQFRDEDYERESYAVIFNEKVMSSASRWITELYDDLLVKRKSTPLLDRYSSVSEAPLVSCLTELEAIRMSSFHLGQMGNQYSVSKTQRDTINHFFTMENGEMLAVNGPPGTGKTTLLQSIISSMWVKAAYDLSEPPIIVVSSTNNQAVTNVIDSFGNSEEKENPLEGRWLPELNSYGLFLSSSSGKTNPSIHTVFPKNQDPAGFPYKMEQEEYLLDAEHFYLDKSNAYSGEIFETIEEVVDFLHQQLKETVDEMTSMINSYFQLAESGEKIQERYPGGIDNFITEANEEIRKLTQRKDSLEIIELEWIKHKHTEPWWYSAFSFMPFIQNKRDLRNKTFFLERKIASTEEAFERKLKSEKMSLPGELNTYSIQINEATHLVEVINVLEAEMEELNKKLDVNHENSLLERLDTEYRYKAFKLATHYWEGKWLLELRGQIKSNYKESKSEVKQRKKWKRYAKLTPCFVSTLYMAPAFFKAYESDSIPLYEFIDLLIIDEAGQVSPEIAGATFSLAKKALVVGDTLQIEPVWNIPREVDLANIAKSGLVSSKDDAERLILDKGLGASSGAVMTIAQGASNYQRHDDIRGMYLTEHRRCVPEIISYCNELAYQGRLEPKRKGLDNYPLPHMGYAHIAGTMEKRGVSNFNAKEADVIVNWIIDNRTTLENLYPEKKIEDIIAVVTPFKAQMNLINDALEKDGLKELVVGTVHKLQGAERPIVIFSPVYDGNTSSGYFFDRNVSMLNVAVSRAKDSFLVFGDMSIFNSDDKSPSGILAKYLFADEANEIKNINVSERNFSRNFPVRHIRRLDDHRKTLISCVESAVREIHIVSPFLSSKAIEDDNLEEIFTNSIRKGIQINVYTDSKLNVDDGKEKSNFIKAKQILKRSGVNLIVADRIHNKSLWVDNTLLIEGSFNWLSTRRKEDDLWCRYETSIVYQGEGVHEMIKAVYEDILNRKLIIDVV